MNITAAAIELRGVRKSYGDTIVLDGIDLTVAPQEVVCVIGPSGSGKSTMLRCINHLEKIDGGEIRVGGDLVGYREANDRIFELSEREIAAHSGRAVRSTSNVGTPQVAYRETITRPAMVDYTHDKHRTGGGVA